MDESGNFQKPLKITSFNQIYLQIEKKIHTRPQSLSNNWINLPNYIDTKCLTPDD